jgi:RNA polymerase sigma-70 factor (ECF subfamily)
MAGFDEAAVVRRCQQGDDAAFRELVEHFRHMVYGIIVRALPGSTRVDDLAQEVFLRVHRNLPYFKGEARLSTWLYRIVANLCTQESQRTRGREVSLDERTGILGPAAEPGIGDRAFSDLELRDRLEKALARLPAGYRLLVAGHYLGDMRYDELAEALKLPLGTVKTQIHRAKRLLRVILEEELQ